ncbi:MAG: hypothetical protein RL660_2265 [Bacteroidota bacterium]
MRKLLFALLLTTSAAQAQITIDKNDMPNAKDTVRRSTVPIAGVTTDFSLTGPNYTWDFSSLVPTTPTQQVYDSINQAPIFAQFIFGPFGAQQNRSQIFGSTGNPLNFPSAVSAFFAVDSAYAYYKSNTNVFAKTGFSIRLNGFDVPLPYDTADAIYRFPLQYGNVDSGRSSFEIDIALIPFLYYKQRQKRISEVDGWGTLKLPYSGQYEVLRQKTVLQITDTINIDTLFGFGFNLERDKEIQYKWLAKGKDEPILTVTGFEIQGVFTVGSITLLQGPFPNSVANTADQKENAVATRYHADAVQISAANKGLRHIVVYNLQGQVLASYNCANAKTFSVNLSQGNLAIAKVTLSDGTMQSLKLQ